MGVNYNSRVRSYIKIYKKVTSCYPKLKTEPGPSATAQTNGGKHSAHVHLRFDGPIDLYQRAKYFSVYRSENLKIKRISNNL